MTVLCDRRGLIVVLVLLSVRRAAVCRASIAAVVAVWLLLLYRLMPVPLRLVIAYRVWPCALGRTHRRSRLLCSLSRVCVCRSCGWRAAWLS